MTTTSSDVRLDPATVRPLFPALASGLARFDGPGGSLTPASVAQAVADTMTAGLCQRGTATAHERQAEETVVGARQAMADLLGADPGAVAFGRSMTALAFEMARTLSRGWGPGDEVVVTRLDHDGDVRPWVRAAERVGATVRWVGFDRESGELDDVRPLLSSATRLVAVTGASNLIGTRPDVADVAAAAHEVGALVHVDAVHLAAHAPIDLAALGADLLTCSPYKFFGPHLGVLTGDPALLERLRPDKLLPSSDAVPERYELGTLPYEALAGVTAAVDVIAGLVPGEGTRRERVLRSMAAAEAHEEALLERLLAGLAELPRVSVHGRAARRTPTTLLEVEGLGARAVSAHLLTHDVVAPAGSFYAIEAARVLGLGEEGGVRVGLSPYTSADEVDRLLAALADCP